MRYLLHNFISTLKRYKMSSLLNVTGMAVAFAAFYIIMTQVCCNLGYNKSLEDADRTYIVTLPSEYSTGKYSAYICRPLGESFISGSSLVESGGMFTVTADDDNVLCWTRKGDHAEKMHLDLNMFSSGGLKTFGFKAAEGSMEELSKPGTIAVSEKCALKYGLHIGDRISWRDPEGEQGGHEIVAIYEDFPEDSDLSLVNAVSDESDYNVDNYSEWSYTYAVKLRDPLRKAEFEEGCRKNVREFFDKLYGGSASESDIEEACNSMTVHLVSFRELFYAPEVEGRRTRNGNLTTDLTLLAVAVLTILIALINFINFFFALVPARLKTVNTYKVFGVSRTALIFNFMFESVGLVVMALALAAVIVAAFVHTSAAGILTVPVGTDAAVLLMTAGAAVLTAVLGSIYPALYITSFQPALVLKGSFSGSVAGRQLRNALICFQFIISISLIICALSIRMQHSYMMDFDMGFNKSHLISGKLPYPLCWYGTQNEAFEDKLRSNPQIQDITWADGRIVNTGRMGWGRDYKGKSINFQCYPVAYNFLDFMGIDIVEGRDFSKSDEVSETGCMIFNEQARKEFDIDLETPGPGHNGGCVMAGICKDFHFRPLQYGGDAFAFYVFGKDHRWRKGLTQVYIRTAPGADVQKVIKFVLDTVQEMAPQIDPETYFLDFFDKELGKQYSQEKRLAALIGFFTLIAIIISLMGVFGLVLFDTQHRSREIAVRRVMGGTVGDIVKMFNAKYIRIVLVAFAIAAPLSWWIVRKYLEGFAYHTGVRLWVFIAALAAVLAVTVLVVTLRSIKAATSNPVEQLKNE